MSTPSASASAPRLERVTPQNVAAACRLAVRPDQRDLVAPVAHSLAEAYASPDVAWPRLVYDGDELVAFVMGAFDPGSDNPDHRCGIWRLNVGADHQGRGYGRFAVAAFCDEARRRGELRVTVSWVPREGGPEGFYLGLGFRRTGRMDGGEVIGEMFL